MPHLARIRVYPIKSLDPVELDEAEITPEGALRDDRRYAIVDSAGAWVNAKRTDRIHPIRAAFNPPRTAVTLHREGDDEATLFDLAADRAGLGDWLGAQLGLTVSLAENPGAGFPDDTDAPGPTVVSTATLEAVAGWFPGLTVEETRLRFRANLEIGGVPAFWEDRLFAEAGRLARFRIGAVAFDGINPCQRCAVPSRAPTTGAVTERFTKIFRERREAELPEWAERSRFDHYYRLAVNTRVAAADPPVLRVGDAVEILA